MQIPDDALMARLAGGDLEALGLLFDRYSGNAYALSHQMLGDPVAASDAVLATFMNVWHSAPAFGPSPVMCGRWFTSFVHRQCIDVLRDRRSTVNSDLAIKSAASATDHVTLWERATSGLQAQDVHSAIATLGMNQRATIEFAYFGGMTQAQVAEQMRVPLGTVQERMRSALEALHNALMTGGVVDAAH